jgi:alpha-tubulin suppressor-like RCC1 family protein
MAASAIGAGDQHTCAVLTDTTVQCWGSNFFGQLGDQTIVDRHSPVAVFGLDGVAEVSGGFTHTCARRIDDSVACWGRNDKGQVGVVGQSEYWSPQEVSGLTDTIFADSFDL